MTDTKTYLGIMAGVLYVVGFLAVQVHLMRFGILEISPLQAYYLIVGFWFLLCIGPSLAIIVAAEYILSSSDTRQAKAIVLGAGIAVIVGAISSAALYDVPGMVLNFNSYPYPSWYVYWNIGVMNFALIFTWGFCLAYSKASSLRTVARRAAAILGVLLLTNSVFFFGRTIYPALDHGIGGGAPQFVMVTDQEGKSLVALEVYAGERFLYLLELNALPNHFSGRSALTSFAADSTGPVYRALVKNEILKMGNDQVASVRILGVSQKVIIDKHFKSRSLYRPVPLK